MDVIPVAAPVEVVAMPPDARVAVMPMAVPAPVQMHVPAQVDMRANVQVPPVAVDMTDHAAVTDDAGPDHAVTAVTDDTVVTATAAAAVRSRIGSVGDKCRHTNDSGGDQSEECSTFEHGVVTFWLDVGHPRHWSEVSHARFKRLI
jgi:hypothetical protein